MYRDLCNFLRVVEEGTFTAASRAAHLSQPALSASIQRLEQEVDAILFIRDRKGAVLTAPGRALLPHARAARAAIEEGVRAVSEVTGLSRGEVRIGAGATSTTYLLPEVLLAFHKACPGVQFRLVEIGTPHVVEAVASGDLDLGIATRLPGDDSPWSGVTEEPWRDDPLIVVASPEETRSRPPYLTFVQGSPLRALLDRHFPNAAISMELGSITAIKGNVRAGLGVALVPVSAVVHDLETGRLVRREDRRTPLQRRLVLVHRGEGRLSDAARALRERLLSG